MSKLSEMIRLAIHTDLPAREIAAAVDVAPNTVARYRTLAREREYTLDTINGLDDEALSKLFNKGRDRLQKKRLPSWDAIHKKMTEDSSETLERLWLEYFEVEPSTGYQYSQFTHYYRKYKKAKGLSMVQRHVPGERGYVDFAGRTLSWTDQRTGEVHEAQIFVAALGYSHYIFAFAVPSQKTGDWITCNRTWLEHLGGAPKIITSDNLKAAVTKPGREPLLNRTYEEFGDHYGVGILPARSRKPRDKAKVENGVRLINRWAIVKLKDRTFFSLAEINAALQECVDFINNRIRKQWNASRRHLFEQFDRPALLPLPSEPFVYAEWSENLRVPNNYHIRLREHGYSVPHHLVGELVSARVTQTTVELFRNGARVGSHVRSFVPNEHTTEPLHCPDQHRAYLDHHPDRYLAWARRIGPSAEAVTECVARAIGRLWQCLH